MNRRIRSIFWLMTSCILGINAFQGFWLWTTYELNRQQFSQTVQNALFSVLQERQIAEANEQFTKQVSNQNKNDEALSVHGPPPLRTILMHSVNQQSAGTKTTVLASTLAHQRPDPPLLDGVGQARVDLPKLSAAYRTELHQHGIDAKFRLDTLPVHPHQPKTNGVAFPSPLLTEVNKRPDSLYTIPVPVTPARHLFAQASFVRPTFYLLQRMGWLLGSSVLLLVLTSGCFLFMLATILNQKKVSDVKNDFINNMTHELKTPIATVTAAVEALQYFGALNDPQKTQTYLTISQTNLQRLSDLVETVLNLAVAEKRELVLHAEQINLGELTDELITSHKLRAPKPVDFRVTIPPETTVFVDRLHFSNALNNLIDNAILYSREQVSICLNYQTNVSGWQLAVSDNGIGILKAHQSAIFDRFFRVPTGNLHPVKGFGLGLAYVRQVVERHGGRISVYSEVGQGSKFVIEF